MLDRAPTGGSSEQSRKAWIGDTTLRANVAFLRRSTNAKQLVHELEPDPAVEEVKAVNGAILWATKREAINRSVMRKLIGGAAYKELTVRNLNTTLKLQGSSRSGEGPGRIDRGCRREMTVTTPARCSFQARGHEARPGRTTSQSPSRSCARRAGGRLSCSVPTRRRGSSFFQKRSDNAPEWLQTTIVTTPNRTTSRALVLADMAHVVWAVNLACLAFMSGRIAMTAPRWLTKLRLELRSATGRL